VPLYNDAIHVLVSQWSKPMPGKKSVYVGYNITKTHFSFTCELTPFQSHNQSFLSFRFFDCGTLAP
jgi:hypothetical protein